MNRKRMKSAGSLESGFEQSGGRNRPRRNQLRTMKKKLYSAVSMLLISALLLGNATYAWVTMSTAPEVKSASTNISGNGSLEIALNSSVASQSQNTSWELLRSMVGDSGYTDSSTTYDSDANTTWGNLIDLSSSEYGLSEISLYPAALNIASNAVLSNPLQIPEYGEDGRIKWLSSNTTWATYDTTLQSFALTSGMRYGVRALGTTASTGLWRNMETSVTTIQNVTETLFEEFFSKYATLFYSYLTESSGDMSLDVLEELVEEVYGIDAVATADENTTESESVSGSKEQSGLIDQWESVIRAIILACSGYSDRYVSISASELRQLMNDTTNPISTNDIITKYLYADTDLAEFCQAYLQMSQQATEANTALKALVAQKNGTDSEGEAAAVETAATETVTYEEAHRVLDPLIGAYSTPKYTCDYVKKDSSAGTTENGTISAESMYEMGTRIESLQSATANSSITMTFQTPVETFYVQDQTSFLGTAARMVGTIDTRFGSMSTAINGNDYIFTQYLAAEESTDGSLVSQLAYFQRMVIYQESLAELQTLWNDLPTERTQLNNALKEELQAIADIYREEVYVTLYNQMYDEYYEADTDSLSGKEETYGYETTVNSLVQKVSYASPENASIDELEDHLDALEDGLDFYLEFTKYAALTYASKETTSDQVYNKVYSLVQKETEENPLTLEEILEAAGMAETYADAVEDYNRIRSAIAETREKIQAYEEQREAEATEEETTQIMHPTYAEDVTLRSALVNIASLTADGKTAEEAVQGTGASYNVSGGIYEALQNIGCDISSYNTSEDSNIVYIHENKIPGKDSNWTSPSKDSLLKAWATMYGKKNIWAKVSPYLNQSLSSDAESSSFAASLFYQRHALFLMGTEWEERYSQEELNQLRDDMNYLYDSVFPVTYEFIWATAREYLSLQVDEELLYTEIPQQGTNSEEDAVITVIAAMDEILEKAMESTKEDILPARLVESVDENQTDTDHTETEQTGAEQIGTEQGGTNQNGTDQGNTDQSDTIQEYTVHMEQVSEIGIAILEALENSSYGQDKTMQTVIQQCVAAMDQQKTVWKILMNAAESYDSILDDWESASTTLDELLERKEKTSYKWTEVEPVLTLLSGNMYLSSYYYESGSTIALPEDSVYARTIALFSDQQEYEIYDRDNNWTRYSYTYKYDLNGNWTTERSYMGISIDVNGTGYSKDDQPEYLTYYLNDGYVWFHFGSHMYYKYGISSNTMSGDDGITPLYRLATAEEPAIQTDRSVLYNRLKRDMYQMVEAANAEYESADLTTLIGTLYRGGVLSPEEHTVVIDKSLSGTNEGTVNHETLQSSGETAEDGGSSSDPITILTEELDEIFATTLITNQESDIQRCYELLGDCKNTLNVYESMLKLAFMIWASSNENPDQTVYEAVLSHYTDSLETMLSASGLGEDNEYVAASQKLTSLQETITTAYDAVSAVIDSTDTQAKKLAAWKTAIAGLVSDYSYTVTLDNQGEIEDMKLQLTQSVLGDLTALYSEAELVTTYSSESGSGDLTVNCVSDHQNTEKVILAKTVATTETNTPVKASNTIASNIMDTSYGFALDLLFRTNATHSNLLLQTEEAYRMTTDDTMTEEELSQLQGGGSTIRMWSQSTRTTDGSSTDYSMLSELIKAMRFVFTDTDTGKILACARCYTKDLVTGEGYGGLIDGIQYDGVQGSLALCNYEITDAGELVVGNRQIDEEIVGLVQNQTTPITVYVYLDGDAVSNESVSSLGKLYMSLNLQFASDADLIPAEGYSIKTSD